MPDPTGPQFDPQPGDTMSDTSDDMYTYTVTSVEGDGDPNHTWVHSTHPDGTSDGGWSLALWAEDCDGRFVYARPASRGGPQTHPRPGDTMTCPDGYVYTVDRVVGDVVYCTKPAGTWSPARWPLWLWSVEDGSVWSRPGATG